MEPNATVQMNKMGHLHIWTGEVEPVQVGGYKFLGEVGQECDVYIQGQAGVDYILGSLTDEDQADVLSGWSVHCWLPEELFGKE